MTEKPCSLLELRLNWWMPENEEVELFQHPVQMRDI